MAEIKFKLRVPTVPNYISFEVPPGPRQDGFKENKISIADLSDEALSELADEWKIALLEHAKIRRNPKDRAAIELYEKEQG